jgi:hypothetical protein
MTLQEKINKMNEIIKEANELKRISKGYEKERGLLRDSIDKGVLKSNELTERMEKSRREHDDFSSNL